MIKVNCLSCGHSLTLGDAYEDYEGHFRCGTCKTVLDLKFQGGGLRTMRFAERPAAARQRREKPDDER
jgi:hypothetical protein